MKLKTIKNFKILFEYFIRTLNGLLVKQNKYFTSLIHFYVSFEFYLML